MITSKLTRQGAAVRIVDTVVDLVSRGLSKHKVGFASNGDVISSRDGSGIKSVVFAWGLPALCGVAERLGAVGYMDRVWLAWLESRQLVAFGGG